jgi:UDP-glucose 4-epimerase
MKVLITGGCGYVGTELVSRLIEIEEVKEVRVYDNLNCGSHSFFLGNTPFRGKVRFIEGDVLDSRSLLRALDGVDFVFHLAAKVGGRFHEQSSSAFEQTNHWGTAELSYAIERSSVRRLVHLSSASVYGSSIGELTEGSPLHPETIYGLSKMNAEKYVTRLFPTLSNCFVLRSANVFGYNRSMRMDGVINRFAFDAVFRQKITLQGSGAEARSFIHVGTLARVLASLVSDERTESGIYNVADFSASLNEIASRMVEMRPGLEIIYSNQGVPVRNICLRPSKLMNRFETASIQSALGALAGRFASCGMG